MNHCKCDEHILISTSVVTTSNLKVEQQGPSFKEHTARICEFKFDGEVGKVRYGDIIHLFIINDEK